MKVHTHYDKDRAVHDKAIGRFAYDRDKEDRAPGIREIRADRGTFIPNQSKRFGQLSMGFEKLAGDILRHVAPCEGREDLLDSLQALLTKTKSVLIDAESNEEPKPPTPKPRSPRKPKPS